MMTCSRNEIGYFHPEDNDANTDEDQNITFMRKMTKIVVILVIVLMCW